jgi:hypothetical protein
MWNWDDPRVLGPLASIVSDPRALEGAVCTPRAIEEGSNTPDGSKTPPNSPSPAILPFSPINESDKKEGEEGANLLLQMVLHPTVSRYARRYPFFNLFKGEVLADNGYVSDDAMDVDSD